MLTFIDLFSGIGGFRLAFESVGTTCVFSAEIDKHACTTYKLNFDDYPLRDVSKLDVNSIPNFDILCAGFPCQPFSIAGKRKGFSDTRGTLFFDIERIIKAKQPKAFILENVKGLMNHDKGRTLKVVLETLEKKLNYKVFYQILNSKDYNVPQNRERIYIIGFKDHNIAFNFPKKLEQTINLSHIRDSSLEGTEISELAKSHIQTHLKKHKRYEEIKDNPLLLSYEIRKSRAAFRFDDISPCLTAKMGTGGNNVPILVNEMRKFTTRECLRIQGFPNNFKIEPNTMQSYKQIGNSISIPVVRALALQMIQALKSYNNPMNNTKQNTIEIINTLKQRKETVSFAESCTGGRVAAAFTAIGGVSQVFDGSVVSYSNDIKEAWLGVKKETLIKHGAVSSQCVEEMLRGISEMTETITSDYAIAISGIAGPSGGSEEKPVGTVYIGVKSKDKTIVKLYHFEGDRETIQEQATESAILLLKNNL